MSALATVGEVALGVTIAGAIWLKWGAVGALWAVVAAISANLLLNGRIW